jgi:hypothetical protein
LSHALIADRSWRARPTFEKRLVDRSADRSTFVGGSRGLPSSDKQLRATWPCGPFALVAHDHRLTDRAIAFERAYVVIWKNGCLRGRGKVEKESTGGSKCGRGKQVAEKGPAFVEIPNEHTSGAKARALFCGIYGTTEVVPFRTSAPSRSFSASCALAALCVTRTYQLHV